MIRRYSLQALVERSGMSEAALARAVGLSGSTLKRAREEGFIESAADRYAVRAGLHPHEVWDHWLEGAEQPCAAEDCASTFIPTRPGHRYCSRGCRDRVGERRRYRSNPVLAERRRASRRAYYAENGDYERARQRRYDRAARAARREGRAA